MRWVLLLLFALFMSGCSSKILLPYEEEKLCNKGSGYGVCGSLSDVYRDTLGNPEFYGIEKRRR
jgi:uncharacterized protein YceK